ncbi:MAG: outer membrane lipoprotein LolB [Granulosicoccus sp.]|jgi:outer membrane lipoprotein LolB
MKHHTFSITLFISILLLQACGHNSIKSSDKQAPTDNNASNIPDTWKVTAKLGIRNSKDSGSVTVNWQQQQDQYHIQLSGPFGQGNATLSGDDSNILIDRPGKEPAFSNEPSALITNTFGWDLPLEQLRYWVRGLPTPSRHFNQTPPRTTYNETGLLAQLEQMGWTLRYSRYQPIKTLNGRVLPHKIRAQRDDAILTLIIKRWAFPDVESPEVKSLEERSPEIKIIEMKGSDSKIPETGSSEAIDPNSANVGPETAISETDR